MIVKAGYDDRNELIVKIPDEMLEELGWNLGDNIHLQVVDGQIIGTKVP